MNVGFSLLTLVPGAVGGSESYVRGLLGEFARGVGPEAVTVLANAQVEREYRGSGAVRVHRVRSYRTGSSMPARALAMAAARVAPGLAARDVPPGLDVVHYPLTVPIPRTGAPTVVTIHDLQHHALPELFSKAELRYRRWAYDGAALGATRVIAISEHTKREVVERLGVEAERVDAIHLGVDLERFRPAAEAGGGEAGGGEAGAAERGAEGLGLPERYVFYPANFWRHKNHLRLLEAFARVEDRELALVLTGQAYGRGDEVLGRARALGLGERVKHLGFVAAEAVPELYRRAEALVFPSLHEGFGAPPVEAMACGCPVAAANAGSLPEVCGDAALLFDPYDVDAIADAIGRVVRADGLRERGLERAREFSWERAAKRHAEVYARA